MSRGERRADRVIKGMKKINTPIASQGQEEFVLPNLSGTKRDPLQNQEIATKKYVDDVTGFDPSSVTEDIIASLDDTYDLGSAAKRWSELYAVLAVVTTLLVGGILIVATSQTELMINASLQVNGSITALDNITSDFYYGSAAQLTGIPVQTPNHIINSTQNQSLNDNFCSCYGSSGCVDSRICFNGTTLRIKVN